MNTFDGPYVSGKAGGITFYIPLQENNIDFETALNGMIKSMNKSKAKLDKFKKMLTDDFIARADRAVVEKAVIDFQEEYERYLSSATNVLNLMEYVDEDMV